jgi:AAA family ATP:ADP antiporter
LLKFFEKILRIRDGEWLIVGLLQLQIFLTITVLLMAKPAATGIFLANFSAGRLPWMYLLTAAVAGIVSYLYSLAMARYSFLRVNLWTLSICLLSLLFFAVVEPLASASQVLAIGLYTWVGVFGVLAASQFWMMANLVFDVRQAKRLFGLIGAGAITGGIVGGYLASLLAGAYGMNGLLYGASLLLLPCLPISWYVWRHYVPGPEKRATARKREDNDERSPVRLILESWHLQLLSGIIALSVITAKLVEFQFSSYAALRFEGAEELTSFFGFWFSTFNIIGLSLQLFFTHRIFQRFGVGNTLSILPAGLSISSIVMLVQPSLNMATFSRLIDGSLKQSLLRVGIEMLFVPVSAEVKRRVKTYLDVMVDTVAGGFGGLLLLLLIDGFKLPLAKISVFIFIFSVAWLVCTLLMRSEYLNTFRRELSSFLPGEKPGKPVTSHLDLLAGLLKVIKSPETESREGQLLFALGREEIVDLNEFKRPLLRLLTHASPAVRAAALRNLSNWKPVKIQLRIDRFLNDSHSAVRNAALEYLVARESQSNEVQIREWLDAGNPVTSGNLFLKLLAVTKNNTTLRASWELESYFEQRVNSLPTLPDHLEYTWRKVLLKASVLLGSQGGDDFISASLSHPDSTVVTAAIKAAGATRNAIWVLPLTRLLSEAHYRPLAKRELLGYGEELVDILGQVLEEKLPDMEDARHFSALLKASNSQKSVPLLLSLVEKYYPNDLVLRKETYRALNTLQRELPKLRLPNKRINRLISREIAAVHLVEETSDLQRRLSIRESENINMAREGFVKLLARRQAGNVSRLFRLLGLRYPASDIIPIYRALTDKEGTHRASALELLDNLLKPSLRKRIIPVLERLYQERGKEEGLSVSAVERRELKSYQIESFERILTGDDPRLKLAVLYLIGQLGDARFIPLLKAQLQNADGRVATQARRALTDLAGV